MAVVRVKLDVGKIRSRCDDVVDEKLLYIRRGGPQPLHDALRKDLGNVSHSSLLAHAAFVSIGTMARLDVERLTARKVEILSHTASRWAGAVKLVPIIYRAKRTRISDEVKVTVLCVIMSLLSIKECHEKQPNDYECSRLLCKSLCCILLSMKTKHWKLLFTINGVDKVLRLAHSCSIEFIRRAKIGGFCVQTHGCQDEQDLLFMGSMPWYVKYYAEKTGVEISTFILQRETMRYKMLMDGSRSFSCSCECVAVAQICAQAMVLWLQKAETPVLRYFVRAKKRFVFKCERKGCQNDVLKNKKRLCGGCRFAKYCSQKCQVYDWNRNDHKSLCPLYRAIHDRL